MQHDPVREADTIAWLGKADDDLRAAAVDIRAEPPLLEDALFHCQQAAEKLLKAFLIWHDKPFRRTHDLNELGQACARIDPTLEPLLRQLGPLSEYAWAFRYPSERPGPTWREAEHALSLSRETRQAIRDRVLTQ